MQQRDGSLATDAMSNHTSRGGLDRSKVDREGPEYYVPGGCRRVVYLVGVSCIESNISCFSHFRLYRI